MTPRFDLVDIVKTLQRKGKYIIIITVIAGILGCVVRYFGKKEYKGQTDFFVANPLYVDRTNIFRADGSQFIDYFAKEDDLDKVMAIAKSDTMHKRVIGLMHLDTAYKKDVGNPRERLKLLEQFQGNLNIKRTENSTVEISYTDKNPELAAAVANTVVNTISELYSNYYGSLRGQVMRSLHAKIQEIDSSLVTMTDSVVALRDRYGIYDMVSPNRRTVFAASIHNSGKPGFSRGLEDLQNVESLKDQLVTDRAQYTSVLGEFEAGTKAAQLPLIQVINKADVPVKRAGFGTLLTGIICAVLGFFFTSLWILLSTYFRTILNTQR